MTTDRTFPILPDDLQRRIFEALRDLRFGSVEIQVHDARIVRITRTESVRFDVVGHERAAAVHK